MDGRRIVAVLTELGGGLKTSHDRRDTLQSAQDGGPSIQNGAFPRHISRIRGGWDCKAAGRM